MQLILLGHIWELIIVGSLILLILVIWVILRMLSAAFTRAPGDSESGGREAIDMDSAVMDQVWRDFPREQQHEAASALATYGEEPYEREVVRVQLAILALAGGDMGKLLTGVERAKRDYRDVLAWSVEKRRSQGA